MMDKLKNSLEREIANAPEIWVIKYKGIIVEGCNRIACKSKRAAAISFGFRYSYDRVERDQLIKDGILTFERLQ